MAQKAQPTPSSFDDAQTALVSYAELVRQQREGTAGGGTSGLHAFAMKGNGKTEPEPVVDRAKSVETWLAKEKGAALPEVPAKPIAIPSNVDIAAPGKKPNDPRASSGQPPHAKGRKRTTKASRS